MKKGEDVFFYHSGKEKRIVGRAKVAEETKPDPTADEPGWVMVKLKPGKALKQAVTLAQMKEDSLLQKMLFVRQSRLSVSAVSAQEAEKILELSES